MKMGETLFKQHSPAWSVLYPAVKVMLGVCASGRVNTVGNSAIRSQIVHVNLRNIILLLRPPRRMNISAGQTLSLPPAFQQRDSVQTRYKHTRGPAPPGAGRPAAPKEGTPKRTMKQMRAAGAARGGVGGAPQQRRKRCTPSPALLLSLGYRQHSSRTLM